MDPNENQSDAEQNDSEVVYVKEGDITEIIDIDTEDGAGATAYDFDDLELEGETEDMDEGSFAVVQDDAKFVFQKHLDSVLCVAIDPKLSQLAVSGGQDDVAFVWSMANGDIALECTGFKDSVHCAAFSHDSLLVAVGDMKGIIKVWSIKSKKQVFSYAFPDEEDEGGDEEEKEDLTWLEWNGSKYDLLAGTKLGDVYCWTDLSSSASLQVFPGHGSPCTVGKCMPDGLHACFAYEDGAVKFWNMSNGKCVHTFAGGKLGHKSQTTCIDCHQNNNIVLTGSTDATSLLINVRSGKVLTRFACGDSSRGDSVEAVGFSSCGRFIATATISDRDVDTDNFGVLTIWETERFVQRHQCKHESGITRLCWDSKSPVVYTATEGGIVSSWDARSGSTVGVWHGHSNVILDMSLSRDGKTVLTASDDKTARVFSTQSALNS